MSNVVRLFPENKNIKKNIFKFPLQRFFHQVFVEIKKRQNDIQKKKIDLIYDEFYKYYLDLYLIKCAKNKVIDFPAFMYLTGQINCQEAQDCTEQLIVEIVRTNQLNWCYSKLNEKIKAAL